MDINSNIIKGCKKNKLWAQKKLFEILAPRMHFICRRYVTDLTDIDDILQDGFLKVFDKIHQYKSKGSFEGWVKRIIINTALYHYRKNKKHLFHQQIEEVNELEFIDNENNYNNDYEEKLDRSDINKSKIDLSIIKKANFTEKELLQLLSKLKEDFRIIFSLYIIENYKHKEIAEMLGIDESTSRSRLSRAKKIIQQELYKISIERVAK